MGLPTGHVRIALVHDLEQAFFQKVHFSILSNLHQYTLEAQVELKMIQEIFTHLLSVETLQTYQ